MKDYSRYCIEELAADLDFLKWVNDPCPETDAFWKHILERHPGMKERVEQATELVRSIAFDSQLSIGEKDEMWHHIETRLSGRSAGKLVPLPQPRKSWPQKNKWLVAASVIALVGGSFLAVYFSTWSANTVTTQYGELRKWILPDGSAVVLNSNSHIRYDKDINHLDKREVWIDGEAFFSVTHAPGQTPFVVHAEGVDIEVLGTEFNVYKRMGKWRVSLNSGKIRLIRKDHHGEPVVMRPGDLVEIDPSGRSTLRSLANVSNISSWKENKWVFDETPVSEIVQNLQNTFGWTIAVEDSTILNEKLSGEMETSGESQMISTLSKALDVHIEKISGIVRVRRN